MGFTFVSCVISLTKLGTKELIYKTCLFSLGYNDFSLWKQYFTALAKRGFVFLFRIKVLRYGSWLHSVGLFVICQL